MSKRTRDDVLGHVSGLPTAGLTSKDAYITVLSKWLIDRQVCAQRHEGDKTGDKMCDKTRDKMCDKMCGKTVLYGAAKNGGGGTCSVATLPTQSFLYQ